MNYGPPVKRWGMNKCGALPTELTPTKMLISRSASRQRNLENIFAEPGKVYSSSR